MILIELVDLVIVMLYLLVLGVNPLDVVTQLVSDADYLVLDLDLKSLLGVLHLVKRILLPLALLDDKLKLLAPSPEDVEVKVERLELVQNILESTLDRRCEVHHQSPDPTFKHEPLQLR